MRRSLTALAALLLAVAAWLLGGVPAPTSDALDAGTHAVSAAYEAHRSDVPALGRGVVERALPDDTDGSRHQRFILRLHGAHTVLVAHNIDLAPRVPDLRAGDVVEFSGEYVWNDRGGVIHWTHHDPAGRHAGGWLRHEGHTYE